MEIYGMPKANLLTRDLYRSIKAMNREAMEKTINNIYDMGAKDALANAVIDMDMDKLRQDLSSVSGIGEKRKIRHRCSMAIALYKDYWNLGIGTAMIGYMTELAGKIGWHQVDLEVVAENVQAQMLYKKCGFIETGRRHNALLFDDGTYHDEILIYKSLK